MEPQQLVFVIPIVAIVMGIGIGMLTLVLDYRKKRDMFALHHKERLAAIEKGIELPPLPTEFFQDSRRQRLRHPSDFLRRGLVLLFIGIAVTGAMYQSAPDAYLWGLVPAAIGVGLLLFYFMVGRNLPPPSQD
ncbi:MAG: DUF6249 domain-containing protein [Steroidobacteraceae bacterium]